MFKNSYGFMEALDICQWPRKGFNRAILLLKTVGSTANLQQKRQCIRFKIGRTFLPIPEMM